MNLCLMVAALQATASASAQQAILNDLASQAATSTHPIDMATMPYTVKSGDFRLLLTPSLQAQWDNNIALTSSNKLQDYIVEPMLKIDAYYPLTQVNLLKLNVGVGYSDYLQHSDYSAWDISSGSMLSFDTYIADVLIDLHERLSLSQDAGAQAVNAAVGNYTSGNNDVGVRASWNPNKLNLSLGYDHRNDISIGSAIQSENGTSELFNGRAGWRFDPAATAGVEVTYSTTAYDQALLNNNSSYTIGTYAEWHPGNYFKVTPRVGYSIFQYQQTSASSEIIDLTPSGNPITVLTGKPIQTSDFNSWYADLTLLHDITRDLSYSLSVGHEVQSGIQSDAVGDSYLRLGTNWKLIKDWDLHGSFSYEHGQEGLGNITGNLTETYNWYTGTLQLDRVVTSKLRVGLKSRVTFRSSTNSTLGYTQALVGVQVSYALE